MFDFLTDAGEQIIAQKKAEQEKSIEQLNQEAADAICAHVEQQKLGLEDLEVSFSAAEGLVTLKGRAPDQAACEKAALAAGNIKGVAKVENDLEVEQNGEEARYHEVQKGETLSHIAKEYYGNANEYNKIFEANKPMLSSADKIYPGQKLRIPT
ncbi:peptidoglycan-binding protein LysM [Cardiobacteriaceae bacterium TAE3-ERU3]|nr:peptidoglycan-binding protein LysM [Cardiobacteriaceae bacterium TAE3-ERU3]